MSCDVKQYEDQLTLFSLGLLEGSELRAVQQCLDSGCEECLKALRENEMVISSLAYSLDDSPLSPEVENKIFKQIEQEQATPAKQPKTSFWSTIRPMWLNLGSAVAVLLLITLFVNNMSLRNELETQRQDIDSLQASIQEDTQVMDYMLDPGVQTVKLAGAMSGVEASGKIMWDENTQGALLLVSQIPELTQGMEYQVWCVEEGKPVSLGTFTVNKKGQSMMEIDSMPRP
ncbi:MAG: anti-sigma factor, partial [Thermodesulfobacteriota bacterium]